MPDRIAIRGRRADIVIELNDHSTARRLLDELPLDARAQLWGDEIYFASPVQAEADARDEATVAVGDVAYWPPGKAVCLFFGPTPASDDDRPVAASPVTVIGRIVEGLASCRDVGSGELISVEAGER